MFRGLEALEPRRFLSTVRWDGGGDGVTLNDPLNWESDVLPGPNDHAVVDVAGNPGLRLTQGTFTVKGFKLDENLTISGGVLSVKHNWSVTRVLEISGGVVDGEGDIRVSGEMRWTGGRLAGHGDVTVKPSGVLLLDGGALDLRRDVFNSGTTVLKSGTILARDEGGTTIINKPGAVFTAIGGSNVRDGDGDADVFINKGVFVRDGPGTARFAIRFEHSGEMRVESGVLLLVAGGSNKGARHVAEGGVLWYYGDYTHGTGSTLTGGGITIWHGGTHTITADWMVASFLHVTDATITGDATLSTVAPISFNSGRLEGCGELVIKPSGRVQLMTLGDHTIARDIVNNGTLIWNRGGLRLTDATIVNNAGGLFRVQADATASAGSDGLIVNHGELRKLLRTDLGLGGIRLDNRGFVNVRNGSLTLVPGNVVQITGDELSRSVLAGGAWCVFGTSSLELPGTTVVQICRGASVTRIGPGAGFEALGGLERNDGRLTVSGGGAFEVDPDRGEFVNTGVLALWKETTLRVDGAFIQTASGRLDVGIVGHTPDNAFISADSATLDGTAAFILVNGFAPTAGQSLLLCSAPSVNGHFVRLHGPALSGLTPALVYLPGGVRLNFA